MFVRYAWVTAKEDMYALSEASQNMTEQRIYQVALLKKLFRSVFQHALEEGNLAKLMHGKSRG